MKCITILFCLLATNTLAQEALDMGIGEEGTYDFTVQIIRNRQEIKLKKKQLGTKNPLYIINGEIKPKIDSRDTAFIMQIDVIMPKTAIKKFGIKGKNGALDIFINEPAISTSTSGGYKEQPKQNTEKIELDTVKNRLVTFKSDYASFLRRNLNISLGAELNIEGKVTLNFFVETDGSVSDITLDESSPSKNIDLVKETIRVIKSSSGLWYH
jgi:hypothetical protein